ncbi:histone-lysine N-methyltransferase SETMAR [Trichonephila clavipes]|uniref:Histone-lysine N-methyltransferase SETMAR n=1 Tax=Trichonephila clavipes TaxID=2585209 RepID=A0A8X6VCM0_TRICX|nr:histone-lysine N-methyltransferase SETMAR [Trichonephila clavipes]
MTGWVLYKLEWDLMRHPPHSLDMEPSDYYLSSHMRLHLDGIIFHSNDEVTSEVNRSLDSRTPLFFAEGIEKLPKRWKTIVDLNGITIFVSFAGFGYIYQFTNLFFFVNVNFLLNVILGGQA